MKMGIPKPFAAAAMALFGAMMAWSQATTSLRGTISDESGASLDGASVSLQGDETGFRRTALTGADGAYTFNLVPPGTYTLIVEKSGFAVVTRKAVELLVNTPATLNLQMQLASVSQSVNVEAEVARLNSVDAAIGNAFNENQVRQLPLLTRNVVELLSLQPGVTPTGEVLGARRDQNNVTLDGVDVNDNQTAGLETSAGTAPTPGYNISTANVTRPGGFNAALPVPLDSVQEFRVTVGGQGANQGRSSGGQVTLVTKSGTNQFHGSAYEYHRNTVTSANNWFNNRSGVGREQLIRNQFGASTGGRIVKDRAFFFVNYEQRIDASGSSQFRRVPSETLKQGIVRVPLADGSVFTMNAADVRQVDPLKIGSSNFMLDTFKKMPVGNDPSSGLDRGFNFSALRFNAPLRLDNKAYVAKMDFRLDSKGMHNLSVRGTLADNKNDEILAQYPGDAPTAQMLNNSRGVSAAYTAVMSPSVVNVFTFGLTRLGIERTGTQGTAFTHDTIDSLKDYTRGFIRIAPTFNFADDLTWTKSKHTITTGINFRLVRNDRTNYANAYPRYSYSRGNLAGLGADIVNLGEDYIRQATGNAAARMADPASFSRAMGNIFGLVTTGQMTYSYLRNGQAQAIGDPPIRQFASNEYEAFVSDSFRVNPALTLTYGLRYALYGVPYERNGLQVAPTFPLQNFYAERLGGMQAGIPMNALPNALLKYDFNGPANGLSSWYKGDHNNFAPRFSFAYSPGKSDTWYQKIVGKSGVVRGGFATVYDRFGSDLVTQFDTAASFGLTEIQNLGPSINFTTGQRYNGTLPALPSAAQHTFPFTPPDINFIGGNYMGISTDLRTPYSFLVNFSMAREIPGGLTIEAGYAGRFARKLMMQIDAGGWALLFKDPKSGITWKEMARQMRDHYNAGVDPRGIANNPGAIPLNPFIENLMPALKDRFFSGSATANYYNLLWGQNAGSDADAMHVVDRVRTARDPNCMSAGGCYTFYPRQSSGASMWTNTGFSSFNGGTLSIRRPFSKGFSFDFNYTLSHAIDNGGGPEAGGGTHSGIMLNPFDYRAFRGSSDFDIRHNVNANALYELPFGQGKMLLRNAPGWLNQMVGGWQLSTIMRYRSGLPTAIAYTGLWPTNFSFNTIAYPVNPNYSTGIGFNEFGNPSLFPTVKEAANWKPMYPAEVGARSPIRLDDLMNFDIAIAKAFKLPWEGHRIQFRGEAFNAFNNVVFLNANLDANSPSNFGQFNTAGPPRVMQFALRYEF